MQRILVVTLVLLFAACSSDDGGPTNPGGNGNGNGNGGPGENQITLNAISFSPANHTVDVGTEVTWVNTSGAHTITPQGHSEWARVVVSESADTVLQHTFNTPGTYEYFCEPHETQGMTGTITVTE